MPHELLTAQPDNQHFRRYDTRFRLECQNLRREKTVDSERKEKFCTLPKNRNDDESSYSGYSGGRPLYRVAMI
jgi:hypothetical protein